MDVKTNIYNKNISLLIKDCQENNPMAQGFLYKNFSKRLFGIALRYSNNEEDAEDSLIETFVVVFNKIKTFKNTDSEYSFFGWIKCILVNKCISDKRKNRKHLFNINIEPLNEIIIDKRDGLFDTKYDDHLRIRCLLGFVQKLPPKQKIVFNMHAIDGFSHSEIEKELNEPKGFSKLTYLRAKNKIKFKLEKKGIYKLN